MKSLLIFLSFSCRCFLYTTKPQRDPNRSRQVMFSGDLPSNDDFTLLLLTNKEVLRMHCESTGVRQLFNENGKVAITSRNPDTGETYLALFNISDGEHPAEASVDLVLAGINSGYTVTNM